MVGGKVDRGDHRPNGIAYRTVGWGLGFGLLVKLLFLPFLGLDE